MVFAGVFAAVVRGLAAGVCDLSAGRGGLKPGDLTPPENREVMLETSTLGGEAWKLGDHAGRVVVVNYFATWCGPCRDEFPDLEKIARVYKERGVDVVGVGLDTDDEAPAGGAGGAGILKAFEMQEKPGFPILLPMKGQATGEMIPYTYLLDKRGRVAYYIVGRMEDGHVRELIEKLLKE